MTLPPVVSREEWLAARKSEGPTCVFPTNTTRSSYS
jgi:hypothetical protein